MGDRSTMAVDIVVFDGVDEMDALGPLEVLRNAAALGAPLHVRLVTRLPQRQVRGAFGLEFTPDGVWDPPASDIVVVTGGGWAARAPAGAWAECERGDLLELLGTAAGTASVMAGVCTGTMLLAHAGIVGHRRATTHRAAWDDLVATGATLVPDRVVDERALVTSGGVTSGIDLALWLVEREWDAELAERIARRMEYERARPTTAS